MHITRHLCICLTLALTCLVPTLAAVTQSNDRRSKVNVSAEVLKLNQLIADTREAHGIEAAPEIDDLTFIRRATLDLAGRMPTMAEIEKYMSGSDSQSRRTNLIDDLVGSAGWDSHRYNLLADMLRVDVQIATIIPGDPYITWLKKAVQSNMRYDQLAEELITANGPIWAPNNGKVGYYVRNRGMPEDHTALTVQYFLGSRIQCAQCHDHPDDYFSRKQFMEVAAFEHVVDSRAFIMKADQKKVRDAVNRDRALITGTLNRVFYRVAAGVRQHSDRRDAVKVFPEDYQYRDASPGGTVQPGPLWGRLPHAPTSANGVPNRDVFAQWVTSERTPRFAAVLANRIWADLFGRGLVEPVDDWRPDNPPTDRKLIKALTELVIDCEYDVELIHRILARTDVYQREASITLAADKPAIAGPLTRRLSAEQVWDSIIGFTVPESDERPGHHAVDLYPLYQTFAKGGVNDVVKAIRDMTEAEKVDYSRRQIRGDFERARSEFVRAERSGNNQQINQARKKYEEAYAEIEEKMRATAQTTNLPHIDNATGVWNGYDEEWVRASETRQPPMPTHFLRIFGASDRQLTLGSRRDGSTLQSLSLMNGVVDEILMSGKSLLRQALQQPGDDAVATIYLALLQREPNEQERTAVQARLNNSKSPTDLADLVWAIVNSTEFIHYR